MSEKDLSEDDHTFEASTDDDSESVSDSPSSEVSSQHGIRNNETQQDDTQQSQQLQTPSRPAEPSSDMILVCSVCLDNENEDDNEIIFCDNCGYPVHEGCYGVETTPHAQESNASNRSPGNCGASTDSDDPTEPWFCEHCCSESQLPLACELCPNVEGIGLFKRTDRNRWVHMICAIYNKHVAFHDTDQLWPVDLSDIPISLYGDKVCAYCDDVRMSRTGICVSCEVGLCKVSAHVSCAYKLGLLHLDLQTNSSDESTSFYCKQHCAEELIRTRLERVSAVQAFARNIRARVLSPEQTARKDRLLAVSRKRYALRLNSFKTPSVPPLRCRPITSSPLAMRLFLQKQALERATGGDDCLNENIGESTEETCHEPTFSIAFVNYFQAREQSISTETENLKRLTEEHAALRAKEKDLVDLIEQRMQLKTKYDALVKCLERTQNAVNKIVDVPINIKVPGLPDDWAVPLRGTEEHFTLTACTTCDRSNEQDSMVRCDRCGQSFHIQCLDPPLDRVPKRHRSYRWHCARCSIHSSQAENEPVSGRRPKRRRLHRGTTSGDVE